MISLVDDDANVLQATAGLLRSLGYDVKTFKSGQALLNWSDLAKTDCIIADLMMPEIDGFELQRRLAEVGNRSPVIFLTAVTERAARDRLIEGGAYDVLSKPCSEECLVNCLEAALQNRQRPH